MMNKNMPLFGTNGIRGVFGKDLSLDFVVNITRSLAAYYKKGPILIGRDGRNSNNIMFNIVTAALNSDGLDTVDAGILPTPCLQYATKKNEFSGGIMITASHNPPEYNGVKPIAKDGVELPRQDESVVEQIFANKTFITSEIVGQNFKEEMIIDSYIDDVLALVDVDRIKKRKFKMTMDLGNGVQALVAPFLAKKLGCTVITVNGTIDGDFPGRGSEPTPSNLSLMSFVTKETNSDIGAAFDGDGDRSIFCDEKGIVSWGDKTGTLLARYLILTKHPKAKIVCPINTTNILTKVAQDNGSEIVHTKVGSVEVSREMVKQGAIIGMEENGGFMYGVLNQVRDGALTTALMLDLMASEKKSLSGILSSLPKVYQYKSKFECSEMGLIQKVVDSVKNHGSPMKIETLDGVKIWFDEESWLMLRPSGTEPLIRIYGESTDELLINSKVNEYTRLVKESLDEN
ncbi:MAG TPA: phosphoglucosamine mutase [Nitrososphaeraceae archaeon]|nr:phosphoglucosamine mutase [Nitrososphaeraceae archaeon]